MRRTRGGDAARSGRPDRGESCALDIAASCGSETATVVMPATAAPPGHAPGVTEQQSKAAARKPSCSVQHAWSPAGAAAKQVPRHTTRKERP